MDDVNLFVYHDKSLTCQQSLAVLLVCLETNENKCKRRQARLYGWVVTASAIVLSLKAIPDCEKEQDFGSR